MYTNRNKMIEDLIEQEKQFKNLILVGSSLWFS